VRRNSRETVVENFTTDFLSFMILQHIRFFHGALQLLAGDNVISGSRFGLSLTLNIEQYEYMMGPNSDAGIKVHQLLTSLLK